MKHGHRFGGAAAALLALALMQPADAAEWSITEAHLAYGRLDVPTFAGGGDSEFFIYTLQHASGWKYGENFFFIDLLDSQNPGFQDFELYGEWYSTFSLGKMTGRTVGRGAVSDIGLIWGFNWGADANFRKYLPGVRLALDLHGFAFANLDFTAYIDGSEGAASGGAPRHDNSYMIDFNFARPFTIGKSNFSIEGHVEFIKGRKDEFGEKVESWILAQPQFRWNPNDHLSVGFEYQFWLNKLGDGATDENTVQALLVWKF